MDRCHCICFHNMSYLPCYSLSFFVVLSVSRSDSDSQCQPGLRCFFRSDLRAIPGCQGEGIRAKDYCYDPTFVATSQRNPNPTVPPPTPRPPTPRPPTNPPPTAPAIQFATLKTVSNRSCGKGQCGKCEGDCDSDQECQKGEFLTRSTCIVSPKYVFVSHLYSQYFSFLFLLYIGLKCFFRKRNNPWEPVPGCQGQGKKGRDYCYDPNDYFILQQSRGGD